jgi:hypothetical protein
MGGELKIETMVGVVDLIEATRETLCSKTFVWIIGGISDHPEARNMMLWTVPRGGMLRWQQRELKFG